MDNLTASGFSIMNNLSLKGVTSKNQRNLFNRLITPSKGVSKWVFFGCSTPESQRFNVFLMDSKS
jgi:hypothetical protein